MKKSQKDFFDIKNTIEKIDEAEYDILSDYIAPLRAFARTTYKSIYVIDYFTQEFEFVAKNPLFLCGLSSETVLKMGYAFYLEKVTDDDYDLLLKINKIGFEFYETIPAKERLNYYITYDFHIQEDEDKLPILINHRLTPIFLNRRGKIWKALCIVSLSTKQCAGNVMIGKERANSFYKYNFDQGIWMKEEKIILNEREKEIIQLSSQGLSIEDIGKQMFLSGDSVKYHRRNLFEKLGVHSINEAIAFATGQSLI